MALKFTVDNLDDVAEQFRSLYVEKDGRHTLAVDGVVPKARLDEFRDRNIATARELEEFRARFDGIDPDTHRELTAQAAKIKEKKLIDAGKLDELIEQRVQAMRADHEKALGSLTKERDTTRSQLEGLLVDGALRDAAAKSGVRATAIDDVLLRGRQTFKVADGRAMAFDGDKPAYGRDGEPLSVVEWVAALSERAPHLFEPGQGSGAPKGGSMPGGGAKIMKRAQFDSLDAAQKVAAVKEMTIVD